MRKLWYLNLRRNNGNLITCRIVMSKSEFKAKMLELMRMKNDIDAAFYEDCRITCDDRRD